MSLVARSLEESGIPTVIFGAGRDIVEHCGVPRFVFSDFPLGSPCGEPYNREQQRAIFEMGMKLLETAFVPRTTVQTPFKWSKGDAWKSLVFTDEQPWQTAEVEKRWGERKELYKQLKSEGKV